MSTPREWEPQRRRIYCATPQLRIQTFPEAVRFVRRVGFSWLFYPPHGPELPSLFEAVSGRRGMRIEDWNKQAELVWGWKNDFPATRCAYYGKALAGKPAVISLELLPPLYALSGGESLAELYRHGAISYESKKIYETLSHVGPMPTTALRLSSGLDTREGRARYGRALDELQRRMLVLPIGATVERGAWASQIFERFDRWFAEVVAAAGELDPAVARQILVRKYLSTVIAAQPTQIARLFGFSRIELSETLAELERRRQARQSGEWIIAHSSRARRPG